MAQGTAGKSLQDLIDSIPNLAEYFYNGAVSPHDRNNAGG